MVKMGIYKFRDIRFKTWSFDDNSLNIDLKEDSKYYEIDKPDETTYYYTYETQSLHHARVPMSESHTFESLLIFRFDHI